MNEEKRRELGNIIKKKGIVIKDKPIELSSGEKTFYYYNIKNVALDPVGSSLIGDLGSEIVSSKWNARSIGGLEIGAIPIAVSICMKSKSAVQAFFVRKEIKVHGLQQEIEGNIELPVVIVDDVTTKGRSVMQAIEKIMKHNFEIAGVITVVDREAGASDLFKDNRIEFFPIFEHKYFKDYISTMINAKDDKTESYYSI
ncbi:MAG TPA: orotate phosphoribosyltransferase [Nitrososphaeraceae archaeon]|nr:orotate phosphoribosyltransferase [Nitrososphaeraceae archaeon]